MFTPTSDVPPFVTPEAHDALTSSTPASFNDIPPTLRFQDDAVEVTMEPSRGWDWSGRIKGKIWVTEAAIVFLPSNSESSSGFKLLYPALTLHALTPSSSESPAHVYCQIDETGTGGLDEDDAGGHMTNGHSGANGDANGVEDEEEDNDEAGQYSTFRELRIYVSESRVQDLFNAMSHCSGLHDSLLPSGEPSSFFGGFGDMPNGPEDEEDQYEDGDEEEQEGDESRVGQPGEDEGEAGRVRSDFHSGGGPGARYRPY
ncbi:regulator of volume decrease after cellular swelling-domain-containing protein [Kockovaella imperatae]|uniref:Regulator of volume decrease after cellular swelling-domain-containing protein n=1 Tax=Kockovaella imperatae TaxID=4999 RepID=A0A1Y1U8E0_9TREE|nr:regulator of volume decrease after cellular swelling-domain-containing protein [Kockovaella imperatae]ORX34301.1 regulator of volume decrease after cellular swelling-domain-containing protein [Kockovaella imperatae]